MWDRPRPVSAASVGFLLAVLVAGIPAPTRGACEGDNATFTFEVTTGIGGVPMKDIVVTDPLCDTAITFTGGDGNDNGELDLNETWTYECTSVIDQSTYNTATVTALSATNSPRQVAAESNEVFVMATPAPVCIISAPSVASLTSAKLSERTGWPAPARASAVPC